MNEGGFVQSCHDPKEKTDQFPDRPCVWLGRRCCLTQRLGICGGVGRQLDRLGFLEESANDRRERLRQFVLDSEPSCQLSHASNKPARESQDCADFHWLADGVAQEHSEPVRLLSRLFKRAQINCAGELKRFAVEQDLVISLSRWSLFFSSRLGFNRVDTCRRDEHVIDVSIRFHWYIVKDAATVGHKL